MSSSSINITRTTIMLYIIIMTLTANCAFADFDTDPFYDRRGKLGAPTYDAITEHIDPFSGNMLIVHTDLKLPGKGGLDVTLNRSYNSLIYGRRDNTSFPAFVGGYDKSPLGPGWSMHMGILRSPPAMSDVNYPLTMTWGNNPVFELPDGTKQIFYPAPSDNTRMVSKDFWRLKTLKIYDYNNHGDWEITAPDGTVYVVTNNTAGYRTSNITNVNLTNVAQVTSITNAAQTANIVVTYNRTSSDSTIKTITDSLGRVVTFTYDPATFMLKSISTGTGVDLRTISYEYQAAGAYKALNKVVLPVGNPWQYDYDTTYELSDITFPAGGKIKYTYDDKFFNVGGCSVAFRVIWKKDTQSIRGVLGGNWTYSYSSGGASGDVTTVTAPNGVTETYSYNGWGNTTNGNVWKVGLPTTQVFNFNGVPQTDSFSWDKPATALSNISVSNMTWGCFGTPITDSAVYLPLLTLKGTVRDGKSASTPYKTGFSNFNSYGDPQTIVETGDASRTKILTYCTNVTKNIVKGKPASESITGTGGFTGTSTASWTYGTSSPPDCINLTKTSMNGVTTDYEYYPKDDIYTPYGPNGGNLKKVTDANGNTMTYEWSNGRISKETNKLPAPFSIFREINVDGTVKSETNGRGVQYKTSYLYDKNLRLTKITPPISGSPSNITDIAYSPDNSTKTETRGQFVTTYYIDGFGRPTGSINSKNITTTAAYKAYGVKDYTDSNIGDKTEYDFFGRPTKVTDKDTFSESYNYNVVGNVTTTKVTDKKNLPYYLTYTAFGDPVEKYLMAVKDQNSKITNYSRNILGKLTQTSQTMSTGTVTRSYVYGLYKNLVLDLAKPAFLVSETNPETGTITYVRDNVGNMKQRTDASGTATYTYDEINRLKKISKNNEIIDFDYDNANNRTLLSNSTARIDYTYDATNRQETKTENIAGKSYLTKYGYTGNDVITKITYPSGRIVDYGINTNNQVTSITNFVNNVSYYTTELSGIHAGLPKSYTFNNNNLVTTPTYNNRQLITDIAAGTSGSALTAHYEYDSRGNTRVFTSNVGSRQDFDYDDLSRLTTFTGAWGSGLFEYYDVGNRKTKTVGTASTTYNYNVGNSNNRLDSTTNGEPASYTYNGNGSLLTGIWGGTSYTLGYNAYDNLTSVSSGGITLANYGYDGDGMRVTKTVNGKTTVYHFDQGGNVISETESNGTLLTDFILLNGKLVAKVVNIPVISVTPVSISFNNVYVNKISSSQTITIRNNGTGSLVIGTIALTGLNPSEFAITTDGCSGQTLATSANCIIEAKFSPTTTGTKNATVSIPSNDPVTPSFSVSLNGTGILPTLTISNPGTGTGTVTSLPGGISCGSVCSASFTTDTSVTLDTSPDTYALFTGWGGACSGTNPSCIVTMDSDKNVSASFNRDTDHHVYLPNGTPLYYTTIQAAYNNASTGSTIMTWATDYAESLNLNRAVNVILKGGFDSGYTNQVGSTVLIGPLTISDGTLRVDKLTIQ
ncbi:MAG: choice-of-anchor D domain-containing protein [Desulfobacteraceae bacterium]|nr:choice-of-anchor D domain-containing protein [Desulfobacteraceae bacterium]